MRLALMIAALLLFTASACAQDGAKAGEKLAKANCGRCHATGPVGASPLAKAPPFREVAKRYPPESLEEALVEGIVTGHENMPQFEFSSDDASAIVAYLNRLKDAK
jgi:cytochrome c